MWFSWTFVGRSIFAQNSSAVFLSFYWRVVKCICIQITFLYTELEWFIWDEKCDGKNEGLRKAMAWKVPGQCSQPLEKWRTDGEVKERCEVVGTLRVKEKRNAAGQSDTSWMNHSVTTIAIAQYPIQLNPSKLLFIRKWQLKSQSPESLKNLLHHIARQKNCFTSLLRENNWKYDILVCFVIFTGKPEIGGTR